MALRLLVVDFPTAHDHMKGERVPRLAVMAHFDRDGVVAPHVARQVEALADDFERLVVVSTADLTSDAAEWLGSRTELIRRANIGYDFLSYRVGLEHVGDLHAFDEVVVCNDSYVGPLRPYREIHERMATVPVDFWGLTKSDRIRPHVQSFYVSFRPWVVRSRSFADFWRSVVPVASRRDVIHRYEVGLTSTLDAAGFRFGSYFAETPEDRRIARRRVAWWALRRTPGALRRSAWPTVRERAAEAWNPSIALADRACDEARLPFVKIDTLRYDPYGLGAGRLLRRCERTYPAAFEGVRDYLRRTDPYYPVRPGEDLRPAPLPVRVLTPLVAY